MSIEYIIDAACAPKESLSIEGLVALVKRRDQTATIIQLLRQRGDQRPPEQMAYTRVVARPGGPVEEQVNVGAALMETAQLDGLAHHCEGCPANQRMTPFGCYGSVAYPISIKAETWLMSLLPNDLKSAAGHVLRSAVTDFKYSGGMFLEMRKNATFFESRTHVSRKWGTWPFAWVLTSDQVLQMLFGVGNLQPSHAKMMSLILGLIQTGDASHGGRESREPGEQSVPLAHAIDAVARSGELGVHLIIDA